MYVAIGNKRNDGETVLDIDDVRGIVKTLEGMEYVYKVIRENGYFDIKEEDYYFLRELLKPEERKSE